MINWKNQIQLIKDRFHFGTNKELEEKLSLSNGYLNELIKGKNTNPGKIITSMYENLGVSTDWLLTGEGEMLLADKKTELQSKQNAMQKIPILRQRVSCGPGQSWEEDQNVEEFVDITDLMPRPHSGKFYGFRVSGSSMIGAGIRGGDIVLFNPAPDQDMGEGIYVFALDGDVYCKLVKFEKLARRIHFYSMHSVDLEKAELLRTVDTTDSMQVEHLHIFGRVFGWIHSVPLELP